MTESKPDQDQRLRDMAERVAAVALAVAAIFTAWSGFQATKWGGVQANSYASAGAARTESIRLDNLATSQTQVDVAIFTEWINAVAAELESGELVVAEAADYVPVEGLLSTFFYTRMRDEFRPALDAWLDLNPFATETAPPSPFAMPEYQLEAAQQADEMTVRAEELAQTARDANQTGDNYVMMTVLFGAVLFFGGLQASVRGSRTRLALLGVGILTLVAAGFVVVTFPIEI